MGRVVWAIVALLLLPPGTAAQAVAPVPQARGKNVAGVSGVLVLDWEPRLEPLGDGVYGVGGGTSWAGSGGGEVFYGRELFALGGVPVALELPVMLAPKVSQAPQADFFEPDPAFRALYFVPRLTTVLGAGGRVALLASMGCGVGWFSETRSGQTRTETGYPISALIGVVVRAGSRWEMHVGYGGYAHATQSRDPLYAVRASLVRRF